MKYLIVLSLVWTAFLLSRKPKEPTDPNIIKNQTEQVKTIN